MDAANQQKLVCWNADVSTQTRLESHSSGFRQM